jgi:hypothetical protein
MGSVYIPSNRRSITESRSGSVCSDIYANYASAPVQRHQINIAETDGNARGITRREGEVEGGWEGGGEGE